MQTIAKKVVQSWAAKGYISDDEVEMCLYNLIRHTFTVAVLCVLTVVGALLGEWSNTIVLIVSILFLRKYTNGYHCKSCVTTGALQGFCQTAADGVPYAVVLLHAGAFQAAKKSG